MSQTSLEPEIAAPAADGRDVRGVLSVWTPGFIVVFAAGLCLFGLSWWMSRGPAGGARLGVVVGLASADSLIWVILLSGVLDRADRYRSVLKLLLALAVPVTALLAVYRMPAAGPVVLLAAGCYLAVHACQALYLATAENMVADLAPAHWPSTRTAMLGALPQQVGSMVAPTVAGLLIAVGALWNIAVVALVALAGSLIAVVLLRRRFDVLRPAADRARASAGAHGGALKTMTQDLGGAIKLIGGRRELVYVVILGILGNLVMFPFYAVLPAFIAEYDLTQRAQALLFGRAATGYAVGLLAGSLLLLRWHRRGSTRHTLGVATAAFGAVCTLVCLITVTHSGPLLIAGLVLCGMSFALLMAAAGSIWLDRTPAAIRVRVFAVRRLATFSSIPVGTMLMGFGGAAIGYHHFILGLTALVGLLTAAWWLAFRNRIPASTDSAG